MSVQVRRFLVHVDELRIEAGVALESPIRRVVSAAVFKNPHAATFVDDLDDLAETSVSLGAELAAAAVAALDGKAVHSYGKASIVGTEGELEHAAALMHPKLGAPLREACGGGRSIIPSSKKRGGPGTTIDIPLHHKDAAFVRSHFDAVEFGHVDVPHPDELVLAVAVTDGGRPLPRVGGLTVAEISGEDGLR
ncbi:MAG: amino acid synthesis family protein [Acidimicrobiales bacterium]